MRRLAGILLSLVLLLPTVWARGAGSFFTDYDAIDRAADSILYLETDDDRDPEEYFTGSGFVAFDDQTFVTNYHVIQGALSIDVYDEDGRRYAVDRVLAVDEARDIAIVAFMDPSGLRPLTLATDSDFKRGQPVAAIGSPEGYINSYSPGAISAVHTDEGMTEIQFTAAISHGSSGGALFNARGEVIGITSAIAEEGQNLNFAVSVSHVIDLYRREFPDYPFNTTGAATVGPVSTPIPTDSPVGELKYPLAIGDEAFVGTRDDPWLDPDVVNVSPTQTVDFFTLTFMCDDDGGQYLIHEGTLRTHYPHDYSVTVAPGGLVNPGRVSMAGFEGAIRYVNVAVTRIRTTDGTTYVIPEEEWEFTFWELN
jgi:hypothetical protein